LPCCAPVGERKPRSEDRQGATIKLREIGEDKAAEAVDHAAPASVTMRGGDRSPFPDRAWQHTAHSIGFLPAGGGARTQKILGVGEVQPDPSLKNARVNFALNALRAVD
jgi:hypothetical protein